MKRKLQLFFAIAWGVSTGIIAQTPFKQEWAKEFNFDVDLRIVSNDRSLVFGGSNGQLAMMDGQTGNILWSINIKEKYGVKKAEDYSYYKPAHTVWIEIKGEKKQPNKKFYFDDKTGKEITEQEYNGRKPEMELEWKGAIDVPELNTRFTLDYKPSLVVNSTSGSVKPVTVVAKGNVSWRTEIKAKYVRTLCSNAIPKAAAGFGGDFMKLMYSNGKVFLIYEGMSVFNAKTGQLLWQTTLDNADFNFGMFKSTQTLGRAGYPEVTSDAVYVADLSKGQYNIKKFDLETGKLLWTSPSYSKDDVVPDLRLDGNILVAQFGGRLNVQTYIPGTNGRPDVCKSEYKFTGNAGVKAFDASTGKVIWETSNMKELNDKFSGAITNIITHDGNSYFASDKNMYAFNSTSGKLIFSTPIKDLKIDKPVAIFKYNNQIILETEEGIASIDPKTGKANYATNTGKNLSSFFEGNAFFIWTGKDESDFRDFIRLDLTNGKILGKQKDTGYPLFTADGEYFIRLDGASVARFKTN